MARIVASIEARMGSSRYPGKVLADIHGKPALTRLVDRLRYCKTLDAIIVATTTGSGDDPIAAWAEREKVAIFRGDEDDVLQRVVDANRSMDGEIVVEITGDATLTDPEVVDLAVKTFVQNDCDVVSTTWKKSFPIGIDAQVFSLEALAEVAKTVFDPPVREHVSLYFYEHPERYRIIHLEAPEAARAPDLRLTLDYPSDRDMIDSVFARLEPEHGDRFAVRNIVALLRASPELLRDTQDLPIKSAR